MIIENFSELIPYPDRNQPRFDGGIDDMLEMASGDSLAAVQYFRDSRLRAASFIAEFPILARHCGMEGLI